MSNRVELANAVFYNVDEIHVEHDPYDKPGNVVYIHLVSTENGSFEARLTATTISCFSWNDPGMPKVFVDGKEIEPKKEDEHGSTIVLR